MEDIIFALEQDDDGYPPHLEEVLKGERLDNGHYRIAETPFHATSIALDDIVQVRPGAGSTKHFVKVVSISGLISISVIAHAAETRAWMDALIGACGDEIDMSRKREFSPDFSIYALALRPEVYQQKLKQRFEQMEATSKFSYAELVILDGKT